MKSVWVSSTKWTVRVGVDDAEVIREAAPIVGTFVGQPLENLVRWAWSRGWKPEVQVLDP